MKLSFVGNLYHILFLLRDLLFHLKNLLLHIALVSQTNSDSRERKISLATDEMIRQKR